jgi:hypothetical protein
MASSRYGIGGPYRYGEEEPLSQEEADAVLRDCHWHHAEPYRPHEHPAWRAMAAEQEARVAAAAARISDEERAALEAEGRRRVHVVLNPEDESDEEERAVPPPVEPVEPPVPPLRRPSEHPWTEWEEGPEPLGALVEGHHCAAPSTVREWRFRKVATRWRYMIQVKLWSDDTVTQMVHPGVLQGVRTKQRAGDDEWWVEVDHEETYGWSPQCIKFQFDKEENALAFHNALLTHLS